jgi:hypothetical protein
VRLDFSEGQQALWDAANSSASYSVSRHAIDEVILECHRPKCNAHHPGNDEIVRLLWAVFCDSLRDRALGLEDGKGTE